MSNESKNLRDLLYGVITGDTVSLQSATATDLMRAVISTDGLSIKVSGISGGAGSSGTSGTSGPSFTGGTIGSLNIDGTLSVYSSSGTAGWFPFGSSGNGIAAANGIVTNVSFPSYGRILTYNIENVTSDTTGATFAYYRCSGSTFNIYLPPASGSGEWLLVKSAFGTITVVGNTSDLIEGNSTKSITIGQSFTFVDALTGVWDII